MAHQVNTKVVATQGSEEPQAIGLDTSDLRQMIFDCAANILSNLSDENKWVDCPSLWADSPSSGNDQSPPIFNSESGAAFKKKVQSSVCVTEAPTQREGWRDKPGFHWGKRPIQIDLTQVPFEALNTDHPRVQEAIREALNQCRNVSLSGDTLWSAIQGYAGEKAQEIPKVLRVGEGSQEPKNVYAVRVLVDAPKPYVATLKGVSTDGTRTSPETIPPDGIILQVDPTTGATLPIQSEHVGSFYTNRALIPTVTVNGDGDVVAYESKGRDYWEVRRARADSLFEEIKGIIAPASCEKRTFYNPFGSKGADTSVTVTVAIRRLDKDQIAKLNSNGIEILEINTERPLIEDSHLRNHNIFLNHNILFTFKRDIGNSPNP